MKISELKKNLEVHAKTVKNRMIAPFDLKAEMMHTEENNRNRTKKISRIGKTAIIAAVLVLCIVIVSITPMANGIKGLFRDIIRMDGAVTGTEYINATDEIHIDVFQIEIGNEDVVIPLDITFKNKTDAPFSYIQEIAISEYSIIDKNNNEVVTSTVGIGEAAKGIVYDGKAVVPILIDETLNENETYFIQIKNMYGLSKADASLRISGNWKCLVKK